MGGQRVGRVSGEHGVVTITCRERERERREKIGLESSHSFFRFYR